jgi:UDP-glucose 4-epimerase
LTYDLNVNGFSVLLSALEKDGFTGRLVYASSAAVYGVQDKPVLQETDALGATLMSPYAASKLVDEILAQTANRVYGLDAVGTRFFNVYGPGQNPSSPYSGVLTHLLAAAEKETPFTVFGDGSSTRDYVYVGDVASAVAGLLRAEKVPLVVNIGSGEPTRLVDLPPMVGKVLKRDVAVEHGPERVGDVPQVCADIQALRGALPKWKARKLSSGLADWLTP